MSALTAVQLDADNSGKLCEALLVAGAVNLQRMIIEPTIIRGVDEKVTTVMFSGDNLPDLGQRSIGVSRIGELISRLKVIQTVGTPTVTMMVSPHDNEVKEVVFAVKRTKAAFRCSSPKHIKNVPTTVNDPDIWEIEAPVTIVQQISQAISAMKSQYITISSANGIDFTIDTVDITNDVFSSVIDDVTINNIGDPSITSFVSRYSADTITTLMKHAAPKDTGKFKFIMTKNGIIKLKINGHQVFMVSSR